MSKQRNTRPATERVSLYDEITTKIIAELEAGRLPWVQPWGATGANAPVSMDECWVSFKGKVLATGHVEFGQFKPGRVFNL